MLIYVRIADALKKGGDRLVERGLYPDFNAVVNIAVQNLLVAEDEVMGNAADQTNAVPHEAIPPATKASAAAPATAKEAGLPKEVRWNKQVTISKKLIAPFPADLFQATQKVPVERWLFGQQNRVLPAKVNTRLFTTLIAERGTELELFETSTEIGTRAAQVFKFLNALDVRFGHGKDDLLSTGFPEPGSEKAISRYANHFGAYESTQGNLTGMLLQWKFVGIKRVKNKTYLLPTKACLEFAELANPILDEPVRQKPSEKFSSAEINWAIDHLQKNVPVEASAYTTILGGLQKGNLTPDAIDGFLRENSQEKPDVSAAFISTQRSGAISRMADLGLVRRQREGTKVAYEITDLGSIWLQTSK